MNEYFIIFYFGGMAFGITLVSIKLIKEKLNKNYLNSLEKAEEPSQPIH
jgi:hypothetical protein